jgi:hypothetical protein
MTYNLSCAFHMIRLENVLPLIIYSTFPSEESVIIT